MSIDAASRERYAPVRRARAASPPEDPTETAPPAAPDSTRSPHTRWLRAHLSWRQALFAFALILGSAYVTNEYFPGRHERARRRELERLERLNRDRAARDREAAERLLDDALAHSRVPACEQLAAVRTRAAACPTPEATADLRAASTRLLEAMVPGDPDDLAARCAAAVTELEAARTRLGCR
jgi:hypothetical protein